ncbi:MAG: hypothetical protein AAGF11_04605 [Myxococcota bacterium]
MTYIHAQAHSTPSPRRLTWSLVLILAGCTAAEDGTEDRDYENVGRVCVSGQQDRAHQVEVDFDVCLSSSCDELIEASCTTTLEGTTLRVEAIATVRSETGPDVICTADCGPATTTCETPELSPGIYTVVYGEQQTELTVPAAEPSCSSTL